MRVLLLLCCLAAAACAPAAPPGTMSAPPEPEAPPAPFVLAENAPVWPGGVPRVIPATEPPNPAAGGIRVLVIASRELDAKAALAQRLANLGFSVEGTLITAVPWDTVDEYRVLALPSGWAQWHYPVFEECAGAFRAYVEGGGGLLVCQPNPFQHPNEECRPALLPYPITFHNWYEDADAQRVNATHEHYITEDLPAEDLPFPADRMSDVDPRYQVLALGGRTESPSLVVAEHGRGRIVVQTANEAPGAKVPFPDRTLLRLALWAARAEPRR